jgi:rod shape-determining protein MreC
MKGECSKRVFKFKTQKDALALENAQLKNLLFNRKDTTLVQKLTVSRVLNQVISVKSDTQPYNVHENYLTLNSGELKVLNQIWA